MLYVPLALFLPVFPVVGWTSVSTVVTMPKTAVYKNGDLLLGKREIRAPFHRVISPPPYNSVPLEYFYQSQFRGLVLLGLDLPHDGGSLFRIKNICHDKSPGFKCHPNDEGGNRLQRICFVSSDNSKAL